LLTIVWSLKFILEKNKWSPIDEYAHMDYIDKLGNGTLPKLSDSISEELFLHIKTNPDKIVGDTIKNREQLGFGNNSYQAKHPPLYYSILVLPDLIMKKIGIDIFQRLKTLRILSYLIFVLGMFLCIPINKALQQLGYKTPMFLGTACVLFGLLICTHERYGLGNNLMSPLIINSALLLLINYYKNPSNKLLFYVISISCLSVFSALTNIFFVPILFILIFIKYKSQITLKNLSVSIFIVLFFVVLFYLWKHLTISDKAFEAYMQHILSIYIPAGVISYQDFIQFLSNDAFQLSFINSKLDISNIVFLLVVTNMIICLVFLKTLIKTQVWLIVSLLIFIYFLILTYFLNKCVATVTWVGFRHYLGFIPIIFLSCFGFVIPLFTKYFNKTTE
jgi:hypothetical protein